MRVEESITSDPIPCKPKTRTARQPETKQRGGLGPEEKDDGKEEDGVGKDRREAVPGVLEEEPHEHGIPREAFLRLQRSGSVTGARSGEAGSVSLTEGAGAAHRPCRCRPWRERARAERRERKEEDAEAR